MVVIAEYQYQDGYRQLPIGNRLVHSIVGADSIRGFWLYMWLSGGILTITVVNTDGCLLRISVG
ncbi:hypothetical protein L484_002763 [Morus notabilis]|uniref:Uncharacterized protein n=1 Tax=Morus notabilis TaxID=981085 RepID=W9QZY0_9ROSA|nr:hypothetical protein L484_002763 [Morus notabilis]